jgi:hypothetical protein
MSLIGERLLGFMAALAWSRPKGAFAEVGVYQGGSAKVLYEIAKHQERNLFLYDTFSGMPFKGEHDQHEAGAFADCSVDEIKAAMPDAVVVQGVFPKSIVPMPKMAFVHADADQYESTKDVCLLFGPMMVPGGMILFDDYRGVGSCIKAVDECFPNREILPDCRAVVRF